MTETSNTPKKSVEIGQRWSGLMGGRRITWTVTRVWKKKAQLRVELEYGWAATAVWIDRMLDSPEWECL